MQIHRFGWEYSVKQHFPDVIQLKQNGYQFVYSTEQDGRFLLIDDCSLQADFLCPFQPGVNEESYVMVFEFNTAEERRQYYQQNYPDFPIQLSK